MGLVIPADLKDAFLGTQKIEAIFASGEKIWPIDTIQAASGLKIQFFAPLPTDKVCMAWYKITGTARMDCVLAFDTTDLALCTPRYSKAGNAYNFVASLGIDHGDPSLAAHRSWVPVAQGDTGADIVKKIIAAWTPAVDDAEPPRAGVKAMAVTVIHFIRRMTPPELGTAATPEMLGLFATDATGASVNYDAALDWGGMAVFRDDGSGVMELLESGGGVIMGVANIPAAIRIAAGSGAHTIPNAPFADPLKVVVVNAEGTPIAHVNVELTVTGATAPNGRGGITDHNGEAQFPLTAGSTPGTVSYTVVVASNKALSVSGTSTIDLPPAFLQSVSQVAGPDGSTPVQGGSTHVITIEAVDSRGGKDSGARVTFSISGGSMAGAAGTQMGVNTDGNGRASVSWTLPSTGTTAQMIVKVNSLGVIKTLYVNLNLQSTGPMARVAYIDITGGAAPDPNAVPVGAPVRVSFTWTTAGVPLANTPATLEVLYGPDETHLRQIWWFPNLQTDANGVLTGSKDLDQGAGLYVFRCVVNGVTKDFLLTAV